jgi:tetratricopeptide (TPR) repeat protein
MKTAIITLLSCILFSMPVFSQSTGNTQKVASTTISDLQSRWAIANYELKDKKQFKAFQQLVADVETATSAQANEAGIWVWSGIIKSTFAGVKGGLGALKYAKAAKADLEQAISIDGQVLQGSAYTSLGTLYYQVPGWPIGFGDNEKAEALLKKAMAINPDGIDSNYFYAQYLLGEKQYRKAEQHLVKAQNAKPRPQRPLADKGRQAEIAVLLAETKKKLAL